jgi:hypothetical protein
MILFRTDHPCLRVEHHRWYYSITSIIHRLQSYLWKPTLKKRLDAYIRTIVVLTGGKLIMFKLCSYGKCMVWFSGLFWIILLFIKLIVLLVNFCRTIRSVRVYFIVYALFFCLWIEYAWVGTSVLVLYGHEWVLQYWSFVGMSEELWLLWSIFGRYTNSR